MDRRSRHCSSVRSAAAGVVNAEEADLPEFTTVSQYLAMLWAWCINLGYAGVHARAPGRNRLSEAAPGGTTPYAQWDKACHYHQCVLERTTTTLADGRLPTLSQVRAADEKTRRNWIKLTGPDAPVRMTLTDAMVKSTSECHHFWIWTASQDIDMSSSVGHASPARGGGAGNNLPQGREAGGAPKTGRKAKGQVLCKKHNDARGCKVPRPDKRRHGCDVLIADNECCGKAHKRADCPHAAASHQYRNDA